MVFLKEFCEKVDLEKKQQTTKSMKNYPVGKGLKFLLFLDKEICLTLCMLCNFAFFFLSSAEFFSKSSFWKNSFRNTIRVSNSLGPDQARQFVGPNLGPNCLQRLSAENTSIGNSSFPFILI